MPKVTLCRGTERTILCRGKAYRFPVGASVEVPEHVAEVCRKKRKNDQPLFEVSDSVALVDPEPPLLIQQDIFTCW